MDRKQLKYKITNFIPFIFGRYKSSGYLKLPKDERDYKIGSLFGGKTYLPKYDDSPEIKEITSKDQGRFNICVFASAVGSKEVDENVPLSIRDIVNYAYRKGYISGNGYSDLRSGQKCLQDYGVRESADYSDGNYMTSGDWGGFISGNIDTVKAAIHKSKTFWSIFTKEEVLEALDKKRPIHCAIPWYSGYNQSGGLTDPWLITKPLGYLIRGHAIWAKHYLNSSMSLKRYNGKFVIKIKNSYSELWGDDGCFYIDIDFFIKQINLPGYGAYINLDLDSDIGGFLSQYDGKDVKGKNSPAIYHIQNGIKKLYLHEMDYFVWNSDKEKMDFELVDDNLLNKIPEGDIMDITKSIYWPVLKHLDQPLNLTRIIQAIKESKIN